MMEPGQEWISLMYAIQEHMRRNAKRALLELRSRSGELDIRLGDTFALAEPEILKAFALVSPSLFVDFLMENPELLGGSSLAQWAAKH